MVRSLPVIIYSFEVVRLLKFLIRNSLKFIDFNLKSSNTLYDKNKMELRPVYSIHFDRIHFSATKIKSGRLSADGYSQ